MAEVCEHCWEPVGPDEAFTVREGHSYHEKCHKCYVCSETNLHDAEVFKGVIFCNSCSQRIFQGCSTARKTKNTGRRAREKTHKRRSARTDRRPTHDGILELTTLAVSSDSTSNNSSGPKGTGGSKLKQSLASNKQAVATAQVSNDVNGNTNSMKRSSVEMGMTTEVTQELLQQLNCPVAECRKQPDKPKAHKKETKKKRDCSDLRIAELGASTEIANMALRNKSELPVIIHSESRYRKLESTSMSELNQKSDDSRAANYWMDSAYSSLRDSIKTRWVDRRIGSILMLPFQAFKKSILTRSSLIDVLVTSDNDKSLLNRIKLLFHEDITEHQKRGLQRLYSTINRSKIPNKLGWPVNCSLCSDCKKKRLQSRHKPCKHYKTSHSYRCMRSQVMRLAGPTSSELAGFRKKVKNFISPGFINNAGMNTKTSILMSEACGNSLPEATKV